MVRLAAVQPLVLVVAEDPQAQHALLSRLAGNGIRAVRVGLSLPDLMRALGHSPGLVLFDWTRPEADGLAVTARLRCGTRAPILVVLSGPEQHMGNAVLEAGASDFVLATFDMVERISWIKVWLARVALLRTSSLTSTRGGRRLRLDRERRVLFVDELAVHITPMESKLVAALAENRATGLSEERIASLLWHGGAMPQRQYLRTFIRQLRQKIERDPSRPIHLIGTPGTGYRLKLG